jgi:cholesterol transport system auxiliary component
MLLLCAGCSSFTPYNNAVNIARFDLGPVGPPPGARPWQFGVNADGSLENTAMRYRLAYVDQAQVMAYAQSRWASSPAEILRRRLEGRLYWPEGARDAARATQTSCTLFLDLLQFEQVFEHPEASHARLSVRAALQQGGVTVDTRIFTLSEVAPTPDASGGVKALAAAADRLAQALTDWRLDGHARGLHPACQQD